MSTALFSFDACRAVDAHSQARGFSEAQLMGQAALASLFRLQETGALERVRENDGRLHILCGTGNNGGDGYALAYHVLGWDASWSERTRVYRTGPAKTEPARLFAGALEECGAVPRESGDFDAAGCGPHDLIIEALLGTGQTSAPRGPAAELIEQIAEIRRRADGTRLVALDVPAGLRENESSRFCAPGDQTPTSRNEAPASFPAPDEIHSYGVDKIALRLNPSLAAFSRIVILPMGFHPVALREARSNETHRALDWPRDFDATVFRKGDQDHKYISGHGVLVGGSPGMEGAALLAGRTFFAAGGGILHVGTTNEETRRMMTATHPTFMARVVSAGPAFDGNPGAVLIGPGLREDDLGRLRPDLLRLLAGLKPSSLVILDAGGLDLIRDPNYPNELRARTLITPHSGEWKRLGGPGVQGTLNGLRSALEWARQELGCFVLLKDAVSCLLPPESVGADPGKTYIHSNPSGSMSVAGSGDVLAGILLARFARRDEDLDGSRTVRKILESVLLHTHAARDRAHPMSEDWPEMIRARLTPETSEDARQTGADS